MTNGKEILVRLIRILKETADDQPTTTNPVANSVILRFCIAILQKMSIMNAVIPVLIQNGVIDFILDMVKKHYSSSKLKDLKSSYTGEQHIFFLDFSTALLANILHCKITQDWLRKNTDQAMKITLQLLDCLTQKKMPASVLMHILICLSYMNHGEKLNNLVNQPQCRFNTRISEFVESYSKLKCDPNIGSEPQLDDENFDIDKRTILDLCAHIFLPKNTEDCDNSGDEYQQSFEVGELNDMRQDDRIKEFENEQGDLIFECFKDEEQMFD